MLTYFCSFLFLAWQVSAIWPIPTNVTTGQSTVWISPSVEMTYNGRSYRSYQKAAGINSVMYAEETSALGDITSEIVVFSAIARTLEVFTKKSFIPWKTLPRNELTAFEPLANSKKVLISVVQIVQSASDITYRPLAGQIDESYSLTITADGVAKISAPSSSGIIYGLETFTQLFFRHSTGCPELYTKNAPITIYDMPKFAHRGLNMDLSRSWYEVNDILKLIRSMSMNKMNRLHLHITDAQSWPLDVPTFPELSAKGAYMEGLSYTPSDLRMIQGYASLHGIEVILEIDMPGHTGSIGLSHPELIAAWQPSPWSTYCNEPPCGTLKLNSTAVGQFLQKLLDDVLPRVKPYSAYFHTGGDELNLNVYKDKLDDSVSSNATDVIHALLQKFVDRNHDQIRRYGMTPMVWEEMALQFNLTLGSDVVVQSWQSVEAATNITNLGHKVIVGNFDFWYLDCGKGQWLDFKEGASLAKFYPFLDYCNPVKNWRLMYSYDPLAGVAPSNQHLVLGGEVHMWSEQTDRIILDSMIWPRASAAAEVLWSGRYDQYGNNRTQEDASPRLAEMRERMVARDIGAGPVQMIFCTQGNATTCTYDG